MDYTDVKHQWPRVIVAGSRGILNRELIRAEMLDLADEIGSFIVVSGTARGPDTIGAEIAESWQWPVHRYPADWDGKHGRGAGYVRNAVMADNAEWLLAFHDGDSRGTYSMIGNAKNVMLSVRVVHVLDDGQEEQT